MDIMPLNQPPQSLQDQQYGFACVKKRVLGPTFLSLKCMIINELKRLRKKKKKKSTATTLLVYYLFLGGL